MRHTNYDMRIFILSLIITVLAPFKSFGQQTNKETSDIFPLLVAPGSTGHLSIIQDQNIKILVNRYVDFRKKENRLPGYRIRIYSKSGQSARQNMNNERARFMKLYPDIPTYIDYAAPNFKIYVGDYRNKIEAFRAYKQIQKDYKDAFPVPSKINLPKL